MNNASTDAIAVAECLTKLDPLQREILALRSLENRSYDEIGRILGIHFGTVKMRIARARACLLQLLLEKCPEFGKKAHSTHFTNVT